MKNQMPSTAEAKAASDGFRKALVAENARASQPTETPYRLSKCKAIPGRWYVHDRSTSEQLGWVTKIDNEWHARRLSGRSVRSRVSLPIGVFVTRREAAEEVWIMKDRV